MVAKANSGHPGIVLGAAPMVYTLFLKHLNINVNNSKWINRDRFVMSAGHGSALLYSMLYHAGFKYQIANLKKFRQLNSKTPGHPEYLECDGVDATTGPLGQGLAMGVGMATAEKYLNNKFPNVINHFTYVLCGDGDLQEGVAKEAMEFAGFNKLSKLIILFDSNDIQLDTSTAVVTKINHKKYVEALGFDYFLVKDGEDIGAIDKALSQAKTSNKPTFIEVKTIIGHGSLKQGTSGVHGAPLAKDDLYQLRQKLNANKFDIPDEIFSYVRKKIKKRVNSLYERWEKTYNHDNEIIKEINRVLNRDFKIEDFSFKVKPNEATRVSSGIIFNEIQKQIPLLIGGSADLSGSTKIKGIKGDFPSGNNINFGVREFAMGAIINGMNLHGGVIPFASTFFVFSDYIKPAIRLAALQKIPSLFIFTHDSVFVGEDGPTHQPIEHIAMFRALPNVLTFRPADEKEVAGSYMIALKQKQTPSIILLTRQNITTQQNTSAKKVVKGAYIIWRENLEKKIDTILLATGSEVTLAIEVAKISKKNIRVVSMPCMELFEKQNFKYKESVLPKNVKTIIFEAGSTFGWDKYVGNKGKVIGIDTFGMSAPGQQVYEKFGFNIKVIKKLL